MEASHCLFLLVNTNRETLITILTVFGLTWPEIELDFSISVADAPSTRPLTLSLQSP